MYRVIEAPPHLFLEFDVNSLQYRDLQFIHSDEMHHLQDDFYKLDGFIEHAHHLKEKRIKELRKREGIHEGIPQHKKTIRYMNDLLQ